MALDGAPGWRSREASDTDIPELRRPTQPRIEAPLASSCVCSTALRGRGREAEVGEGHDLGRLQGPGRDASYLLAKAGSPSRALVEVQLKLVNQSAHGTDRSRNPSPRPSPSHFPDSPPLRRRKRGLPPHPHPLPLRTPFLPPPSSSLAASQINPSVAANACLCCASGRRSLGLVTQGPQTLPPRPHNATWPSPCGGCNRSAQLAPVWGSGP